MEVWIVQFHGIDTVSVFSNAEACTAFLAAYDDKTLEGVTVWAKQLVIATYERCDACGEAITREDCALEGKYTETDLYGERLCTAHIKCIIEPLTTIYG